MIELSGCVGDALNRIAPGAVGEWPVGSCRLRTLADIDTVLIVRVSETLVWIMPHGGPRIVQLLAQWLVSNGVAPSREIDPRTAYPEAASLVEALALNTLHRAASPLAVDLLLDQHRRWRSFESAPIESMETIRARSRYLNRLVAAPLVVVVGRPNVGKSTLTNALLGREGSITSEQQGTTRDYVMADVDLAGLVVRWCDTPGRRETSDQTEREAIEISSALISQADCLVSATAPGIERADLPREADLHISLKGDLSDAEPPSGRSHVVSARTGMGLASLVGAIRSWLVPDAALKHPGPWLFDDRIDVSRFERPPV